MLSSFIIVKLGKQMTLNKKYIEEQALNKKLILLCRFTSFRAARLLEGCEVCFWK